MWPQKRMPKGVLAWCSRLCVTHFFQVFNLCDVFFLWLLDISMNIIVDLMFALKKKVMTCYEPVVDETPLEDGSFSEVFPPCIRLGKEAAPWIASTEGIDVCEKQLQYSSLDGVIPCYTIQIYPQFSLKSLYSILRIPGPINQCNVWSNMFGDFTQEFQWLIRVCLNMGYTYKHHPNCTLNKASMMKTVQVAENPISPK